jgi:hypothetical protein
MSVFLPEAYEHFLVGTAGMQRARVDGLGIIGLRTQQEIQGDAYSQSYGGYNEDDDPFSLVHIQLILTIS